MSGFYLCDGKAPEGCENDGELYVGNAVQWFETWEKANEMRQMINAAYGYRQEQEIIGQTVKNDGYGLTSLLNDYGMGPAKHEGNFVFSAMTKDGKPATITTYPVDDDGDYDEIEIRSIEIGG